MYGVHVVHPLVGYIAETHSRHIYLSASSSRWWPAQGPHFLLICKSFVLTAGVWNETYWQVTSCNEQVNESGVSLRRMLPLPPLLCPKPTRPITNQLAGLANLPTRLACLLLLLLLLHTLCASTAARSNTSRFRHSLKVNHASGKWSGLVYILKPSGL